MRRYFLIGVLLFFSVYMLGCGKKQAALEEGQEPMSMEALGTMNASVPESKLPEAAKAAPAITPSPTAAVKLEPLPPAGPYRPSVTEIQTALKNAGFYLGEIDGKYGPKTRRAVREFQQANSLAVDGKVGPRTWNRLSAHSSTAVGATKKDK